jgi:hypothetical protein
MGPHGLLRDTYTFLYVENIRTSLETHLWASTALRGQPYFLYVDDVRTSQETYIQAFTAGYGDSFTFPYLDDVCSQKKHFNGSPWPPTGIVWLSLP